MLPAYCVDKTVRGYEGSDLTSFARYYFQRIHSFARWLLGSGDSPLDTKQIRIFNSVNLVGQLKRSLIAAIELFSRPVMQLLSFRAVRSGRNGKECSRFDWFPLSIDQIAINWRTKLASVCYS